MPPQNQPYPEPGISAPLQPRTDVPTGQPPKKSHKLLVVLIIVSMLLVGSFGFGIYAYAGMIDAKTIIDKKVEAKVKVEVEKAKTAKDNEFAEKEKIPTKSYKGKSEYGSVEFQYPKTWSAHVSEKGSGSTPVSGYLHPNFVPALDGGTSFALRFEVANEALSEAMKTYDSKLKSGKVATKPYTAPNVPSALGARLTGEISENQKGVIVVLPIRDKTLKIWTESDQYIKDLDMIVLSSLKFVP